MEIGPGGQRRRRLRLGSHQGHVMALAQQFPGELDNGVFRTAQGAQALAHEG